MPDIDANAVEAALRELSASTRDALERGAIHLVSVEEAKELAALEAVIRDRYVNGRSKRTIDVFVAEGTPVLWVTAPVLPPEGGEKLLAYVCSPTHLEAVLGDLEERFHFLVAKFGPAYARRWYWWQVIVATMAFAARGVERAVSAISPLAK